MSIEDSIPKSFNSSASHSLVKSSALEPVRCIPNDSKVRSFCSMVSGRRLDISPISCRADCCIFCRFVGIKFDMLEV